MVKREVELGTGAVCMTDHGTLQSARLIYRLAQKQKLRPILGLEAYFRDDDCPILAKHGIVKQPELDRSGNVIPGSKETVAHYAKYHHLTLHALDQEGFETLVRVLSAANEHPERHGSETKPIFTWKDIEELGSKNITFGTGCLVGMVGRHLLKDQGQIAVEYYERLRNFVKKGNLYVEVMPHDCSKNWVNAVFLRFRPTVNGIVEDERKYHDGKWLRITWDGGKPEELRANALAERWSTAVDGKSAMPRVELLSVKHYQTWTDEPEPLPVDDARKVEDFVANECRPWCPDGDVQRGMNRFMMLLSKKYGDPILISDDSHFAYPEEKVVQDVRLFSMESEKTKGAAAKWRFYGSYHRKTSDEVWEHFEKTLGIDLTTMTRWVQNNVDWSKRFDWKFKDRKSLPTKFYPDDTLTRTMEIVKQVGRMDWTSKERRDRLAAEIRMLHKNGTIDLLPYFFVDHEVCERYEKHGELTGTGRGSAAGLSLAYYMGITHVDPLKYGLSKERFLTESRIRSGKLPDIDQDLPSHDLLYDEKNPQQGWLMERFAGHVARISTNGTLRLRSAAQDVSRVLHGEVLPEVFQLTKKFPKVPQGIKDYDFVFGYLDADKNPIKGAIETDDALKEYKAQFPKEWDIVVKALGLTRQKSQHACAFVMTNEPITNFIPTAVLSDGTRITEYVNSAEDPAVEDSGGVKMDFLQLKTLRDIQGALKLIQQRAGYTPKDETINGVRVPGIRVVPVRLPDSDVLQLFDVWDLPEDQAVFNDICRGDTVTVFQFGTPGARQLLENFHNAKTGEHMLRSIEHIAAFTALDRPGPLDASVTDGTTTRNMLEEFAARSRGEKPIGNMPVLDKLFPETFGVITYQEQLQKCFVEVGKTTAEQGDEFRVHVSKKKMEQVLKDKAVFMPGAIQTIGESEANRLWGMLETFGQYGFNKSHSVCYAATGYVCAWLKHHYPLEWWTSCLRNADRKSIDQKFWVHCRQYIRIPDVRLSQEDFAIEGDAIRSPLRLLTGVGDKAHEELVAGRPYQDIRDFIQRIYDHKAAGGTTVEKIVKKRILKRDQVEGGPTHTETKVKELKLGRSSLNRTILLKLIVSGALDSLFPPETSTYDKMTLFAKTWAEVFNLVRKDGSLKIEPVDDRFDKLTKLQHFLLKKSVLPSYAADLTHEVSTVREDVMGGKGRYAWKAPRMFEGTYFIPLVNGNQALTVLEKNEETADGYNLPDRFKFGVVAYINDVKWFWNGQAARVSFEVDGERLESVVWPRKDYDEETGEKKRIPVKLPENLVGSVAILTLSRWAADKNFSLDDIVMVEPPFNLKADEE